MYKTKTGRKICYYNCIQHSKQKNKTMLRHGSNVMFTPIQQAFVPCEAPKETKYYHSNQINKFSHLYRGKNRKSYIFTRFDLSNLARARKEKKCTHIQKNLQPCSVSVVLPVTQIQLTEKSKCILYSIVSRRNNTLTQTADIVRCAWN